MEARNLLGRIGRLTILLAQQFSWPPPTPRDALQGFVPGRTADPGRVQRRGQSLDPSAWHPFGWSADAELLQRAVMASRVLVTADLDLPRLARWLGASVPGLIRYAEGTTVRRTAWNGSDRFWRRLRRMSDTERQRRDGDQREARLLKKHARAIAGVLPKRVHFSTPLCGDSIFYYATVE